MGAISQLDVPDTENCQIAYPTSQLDDPNTLLPQTAHNTSQRDDPSTPRLADPWQRIADQHVDHASATETGDQHHTGRRLGHDASDHTGLLATG